MVSQRSELMLRSRSKATDRLSRLPLR